MALIDNLRTTLEQKQTQLLALENSRTSWISALEQMKADLQWLIESNRRGKNDAQIAQKQTEVRSTEATIAQRNAEITALAGQIKALQEQINALVNGTSSGLATGMSEQQATVIAETQFVTAQKEAVDAVKKAEEAKKNRKLFITIGAIVLIVILGIVIYKYSKK